jgi:tetratricopeptide (TPR) repeat protein
LESIGKCHDAVGHFAKALISYEQSLEIRKRILAIKKDSGGVDAADAATEALAATMSNMGSCCSNLSLFAKAIEYYEGALSARKKLYGKKDRPEVAMSLNDLGMIYGSLGEYRKCLSLNMEALAIVKRLYKSDHPGTAAALNSKEMKIFFYNLKQKLIKFNFDKDVANCFVNLGDFKRAIEYGLKALEIVKRIHPNGHPSIAAILNNLGMYYMMF